MFAKGLIVFFWSSSQSVAIRLLETHRPFMIASICTGQNLNMARVSLSHNSIPRTMEYAHASVCDIPSKKRPTHIGSFNNTSFLRLYMNELCSGIASAAATATAAISPCSHRKHMVSTRPGHALVFTK